MNKRSGITVTIYTLTDPRTNSVRYVGATIKHPEVRLGQHITEARTNYGVNREKNAWVRELAAIDLCPVIASVEECDFFDKDARETAWIQSFKDEGADLLNYWPQRVTGKKWRSWEKHGDEMRLTARVYAVNRRLKAFGLDSVPYQSVLQIAEASMGVSSRKLTNFVASAVGSK